MARGESSIGGLFFLLLSASLWGESLTLSTASTSSSSSSSRRRALGQWLSSGTAAGLLLSSSSSPAGAACLAGDLDVAKCLGYYRPPEGGGESKQVPAPSYEYSAKAVGGQLYVVKGWRALVGQRQWTELGRQILALSPDLQRGASAYCESLLKEPLTGGTFEGMSAFRQVETCRYAYEDANAALFEFEAAVATAYRSSSAGLDGGGGGGGGGSSTGGMGAGSGGGGALARFGGAGTGGAGPSMEQQLAVLSALKEVEVRMYVLAASMGLVTLKMEPEVIERPPELR